MDGEWNNPGSISVLKETIIYSQLKLFRIKICFLFLEKMMDFIASGFLENLKTDDVIRNRLRGNYLEAINKGVFS